MPPHKRVKAPAQTAASYATDARVDLVESRMATMKSEFETEIRALRAEFYEQKCDKASAAETTFNGATRDTLEKAEALEKHAKTVAMTAESLATTEADFFKTCSTARKKHRGTRTSSQRSYASTAPPSAPHSKNRAAQKNKKEGETSTRALSSTREARGCSFFQHIR